MRSRAAFTLVELLVALGVGSSLLVLSASLACQSMRMATHARVQSQQAFASRQFLAQLRHDVHQAQDVLVEADRRLQLSRGQQTVEYVVDGPTITRRETGLEGLASRSELQLSEQTRVRLERLEAPSRIVLQIEHDSGLHAIPPRIDRRLEIVVGRQLDRGAGAAQAITSQPSEQ